MNWLLFTQLMTFFVSAMNLWFWIHLGKFLRHQNRINRINAELMVDLQLRIHELEYHAKK